jgi:hypothetical protein
LSRKRKLPRDRSTRCLGCPAGSIVHYGPILRITRCSRKESGSGV